MINYRSSKLLSDVIRARMLLDHLPGLYPGFDDWFVNKAMPDIMSGDGVLMLAEDGDELAGLAIGRNGSEFNEAKLRCIRVSDRYKSRGVALHLIDRVLPIMGDDKPAISVAEEMMHDFSRILINRYNFSLDYVAKGLYRKERLEYFFNEKNDVKVMTPYGQV